MQNFPLFLMLRDRRALVVGGSEPAARKIELLLAAGAQVTLIAETVVGEIAQSIADGRICWGGHTFDDGDLDGVSIVIVAGNDDLLAARVARAAEHRGVPVNVVDRPALSSFIMPAIVDRGPITIAISTGGAAPALARKLKAEIEHVLPAAIGRLARFAEIFRAQVRRTLTEPRLRRRFWDRVFEGHVGELALAGDEIGARRELIRLLDATRTPTAPATGMVHLVGAGPGDPDLLTLKAHRLLQHADVVVHDRSVRPEILAMARRDAERVAVGDEAGTADRLVVLARAGRSVVRLTAGDPLVFGRGGEEVEALLAAGIAVEVVPGITAGLGCAASAGIALTHRDHAQACMFANGHLVDGRLDLDWVALARPRQTVVLYAGPEALSVIARQLLQHGLPAGTPVALVENGTTDGERRVVGTLGTIERQAMRAQMRGPAVCVIGDVVRLAAAQSPEFRFESRMGL